MSLKPSTGPEKMFAELTSDCVLIYDQTLLEWNATPEAANIEDNDLILVLEKSFFANLRKLNGIPIPHLDVICNYFSRTARKNNKRINGLYGPAVPMLAACKNGERVSANGHWNEGRLHDFIMSKILLKY